MHNKQYLTALWIAIAVLGCGLALIALAGQTVSAQSETAELKPPFRFVERPSAPEAETPPPGSAVIMTETFGVTFLPTTTLQGSAPLWRVSVNAGDTAGYYWARVGSGAFSNSAWSAADPITSAPVLNPGVSPYPAGQDSWLIYGPINLTKFEYAHLSFEYYLDSQAGDTLLWGYSTDGQTFYGSSQSGSLNKWITDAFSFRTTASSQSVYLAFAFNSHSNPLGKGSFVRNVRLTGAPLKLVYLPVVTNRYIVPGLYNYTFDPGGTDLAKWGGAYYNTGTTKYGQCIPGQCAMHATTAHGNPADSLRLYTNGTYKIVASSPNTITPNDYDLYVDMSPVVIYPRYAGCAPYCPSDDLGDWYGIIFNATSDTFGTNPSQFAYNKAYYRLYFYNVDAPKPIGIILDRCDGSGDPGNNSCHRLGSSSLPGDFIGGGSGFDTVHIRRLASGTIQVWLNNALNPVITATDATYTGASHGEYGIFMFSSSNNAAQFPYEMQVDFDNIRVYGF